MSETDLRRRLRNKRYGTARHKRTRQAYAALVLSGQAKCIRCGFPIEPGEPFDTGHDDRNPHFYSGPEHERCNRGAPHRNKTSREW